MAKNNDPQKAMGLYRANLRLSHKMFAALSIFEITLRNTIDNHYQTKFGQNWLLSQSNHAGFFWSRGCEKTRDNLMKTIGSLGTATTNDNIVCGLSFGFWRYLFASKEFSAGGSSLLLIFPKKPFGVNHTQVFNLLSEINWIRNRIAHHEPICFAAPASTQVSTKFALHIYQLMANFFKWLDADSSILLAEVDFVQKEIQVIDSL